MKKKVVLILGTSSGLLYVCDFVMSKYDMRVFIFLYFVLLHFMIIIYKTALMQEGRGSRWEVRWGGPGRSRARRNWNQNIQCEKIIYFL